MLIISDMEAFDVDDPAIKGDDNTDEGVIELPGGPDDELDLNYLISKLDLANELQTCKVWALPLHSLFSRKYEIFKAA